MDKKSFEKLVEKAVDNLPPEFAGKLENIAVVVEDEPSLSQKTKLKLPSGMTLFGLYEGVPRTKRAYGYASVPPDKITIFQKPIEYFCNSEGDIINQVRKTVLHEIGHYFGLSEEDLRKHK